MRVKMTNLEDSFQNLESDFKKFYQTEELNTCIDSCFPYTWGDYAEYYLFLFITKLFESIYYAFTTFGALINFIIG